jgi:drug/metabolite transporter (DMT)-like permease
VHFPRIPVLFSRANSPLAPSKVEDHPLLGIGLMLLAMALASIMDGLCKVLAVSAYHPIQIAWGRFLFITLFLLPPLAAGRFRALQTARPGLQLLRGLAMLGSSVFFIGALPLMPLADATALAFVTPFFVTALAIPLLGERIGVRRWTAVAVGFIGVLLIVRPSGSGFQAAALLPVVSAACGALGFIITRMMRISEPTLTTLVISAFTALAATSAAVPLVWQPLDASALYMLVGIGGLSALSQYVLVLAFQRAEPSLLAPFLYSQILWATMIGFVLFGALPDMATLIGAAIIIACALYVLYRERAAAQVSTSVSLSSAE